MEKDQPLADSRPAAVRTDSTARGMMPRPSPWPDPSIVCVLPLPVWPYENRHTLYPSRADCTSADTSLNTTDCVVLSAANTRSKPKLCATSPMRSCSAVPSGLQRTTLSPGLTGGRTRT